MFKGWSSWLGAESEENEQKTDKQETAEKQNINTETEETQHILQQAKGLSGFILNFASSASKKISESVAETAQTIKKTVEESNIDGIIDKTILGDFQKEQEKFVQEKNAKKTDAAVPPWVGCNEEETIQQQILALSAVSFSSIFKQLLILILISEPVFCCFTETIRPKTPPVAISAKAKASEEEEDISTSPGVSEFVSDAFDACDINQEDLRKEMEQLVLDKKDEETADWEKELQQELQEYEVVVDPENREDNWDREIEEMLQDDS
ncbi:synapse-associated protein 1-like [Sinocyclocheilus anshuiensis]|uniref:synapse-associated protein 1-like n=1 Tax=Sinocyclocheilus anshuiensis TaxID=1608454 RepID=UPI0007B838CB|nr:PREDICTED: synapse-associated protein 1-like [Sinocyclocheilus anshuiensis]